MQFIHSPLTWAFFAVLLPVLIHLINMMRHQRVKWAAMEFLLASYKKHRKWVWLKQFLLLLSRMAAVAIAVAMCAQLVTLSEWASLFGGKTTHHYVLLDDSYSMGERMGGMTAFDRAKEVLAQLAAHAAEQDRPQKLTLLRFSQATAAAPKSAGAEPTEPSTETRDDLPGADFLSVTIDGNFAEALEEKRRTFDVTQLAVGPTAPLALLDQFLGDAPTENAVVHILSDFRNGQWENPAEPRELLRQLQDKGAEIHLVRCVRTQQNNLGLVELDPADETRAAGVPLLINVRVKNYGSETARRVPVKVRSIYYEPREDPAVDKASAGKTDDLPALLIDEIRPGETVTRQAQVMFPRPGNHLVEAWLPDDALATDNRRWCVVDTPEGEPVLVIDSQAKQRNAYFLESVFAPGQRTTTGILPQVKPAAFLRDATAASLAGYRAIYLCDVDRLDERAVQNLEQYVRAGGGLAFFAGPNVNFAFYNNQLYKNGTGIFPLPLERADVLPPAGDEKAPDIDISDHYLFKVFLGQQNSFLKHVTVEGYLKAARGWKPAADSSTEVIAKLRNGQPLVVEHRVGEGRVVAFLTTLAPDWNNWAAHDPTFVVVILKLQSYLASSAHSSLDSRVGTPLTVQVDADKYRPQVTFLAPGATPETPVLIERQGVKASADSPLLTASIGVTSPHQARSTETDRSGLYEAFPMLLDGKAQVRRYALNVEPSEGDLGLMETTALVEKLNPVKPQVHAVEDFSWESIDQPGFPWSQVLLGLLLLLLLGEQLLAFSASYHPTARGAVP